jgi:outer membrane lipoprotein-sorting protein
MGRILVQVSVTAIFLRHHALRWIVPTGVAGIVALGASGVLSAQASPNLPARTAAQLLADVENAHVEGFSGTIVAKASLGLPSLPAASSSGSGLLSLLTDSHTARIWYAGPDKQRFALLDTLGETDVFHNGSDVWTYDSTKHLATHIRLPADADKPGTAATTPTLTPQQAADQALKAIDPTTVVSTDSARRVAGRAAYELVLAPRDTSSRIGSVRIAIDGKTKVPIGVQVYSRGGTSPALDVSFTRVHFGIPDADNFTFTPPKSAHVKQESLGQAEAQHQSAHPDGTATTIGKGWTTIVELRTPDLTTNASGAEKQLLDKLPRVTWAGGSGKLFESKLLTALITDDGHTFVGPVDKNALISAAEHHK